MIIYISLPSYQRNIGHQCGRKMRPTHVEAGISCQKLSVLILKEGAECWNARYFPIFSSPEKAKCVLSALPPLLSRVYCHRLYFGSSIAWSIGLLVFVSPFEKSGPNLLSSNIQSQKGSSETKRQKEVVVNPIVRIKSDFIRTDSDKVYA